MANFCTRCGAPLGGAFCTRCGQPAQPGAGTPTPAPPAQAASSQPVAPAAETPAPPALAASSQPAAPAAKSGGPLLKIVLIVVAVFIVLGMIGVGSMVYMGYRLKQRAERVAHDYGIDLSTRRSAPGSARRAAHRDGCLLLSKDEVQALFGVAVERAVSDPSQEACTYMASPEGARQQEDQARKALAELTSGKEKGEAEAMKAIEQVTKGLAGGVSNSQGNPQVLSISVEREGGKAAAAGVGIFAAWSNAMAPQGGMTKVEGLGDRAMFGPMDSMLWVLQGDTMITMDLRTTPGHREQAIAAARKAISRL